MVRKKITRDMLKRIDKDNMLDLLLTFPNQCERAMAIGKITAINNRYNISYRNIVFLGLGGSAIGADIIRSYLIDESKIPMHVVRDYTVPEFVNQETLIFATSYSGNTEEVISAYHEAKKRKSNIIIITSGGKLEELAKGDNNLLVTIPKGFPPRCALGYSFIPALAVLSKLNVIGDKTREIKDSITLLKRMLKNDVGPNVKNNVSKTIASRVFGKFPVIYAAAKYFDVAAVRWRGQLAENSKVLASMHVYPEMNHNEIVGWVEPSDLLKKFVIITLRDKSDHPRVKKRMDISKSILEKSGFKVIEVYSKGNTLLSRILSLIFIGDFVSFYLSIMYGINPTPVERVTYLKKRLADK